MSFFSVETAFYSNVWGGWEGILSWPIISHVAVVTGGTRQGQEGL